MTPQVVAMFQAAESTTGQFVRKVAGDHGEGQVTVTVRGCPDDWSEAGIARHLIQADAPVQVTCRVKTSQGNTYAQRAAVSPMDVARELLGYDASRVLPPGRQAEESNTATGAVQQG